MPKIPFYGTIRYYTKGDKRTVKKLKKFMIILLAIAIFLGGCVRIKKSKEWTYELLEKEFGGIIEVDFKDLEKCLKLIEEHDYNICGYVIPDDYYLNVLGRITDDKENSNIYNTMDLNLSGEELLKLNDGDFVYASGRVQYADYKTDTPASMRCDIRGNVSIEPMEKSVTIKEYINQVKKIGEDTYFQIQGLIIKDDENYVLYESKETYKEDKFGYIRLNFAEEQHNLNGKIATIIGKPDLFLFDGLKECNVID